MPPLEMSERNQKAVLFLASGFSNEFGRPEWKPPEEIKVRWEWVRSQIQNVEGAVVVTVATVVVDRDIPDGSRLWLGELEDWYGTGSGGDDGDLYETVGFDSTPDLKGRLVRRELKLIRANDSMPYS